MDGNLEEWVVERKGWYLSTHNFLVERDAIMIVKTIGGHKSICCKTWEIWLFKQGRGHREVERGYYSLFTTALGLFLSFLLSINFIDDSLNAGRGNHFRHVAGLNHAKLDVLLGFDDLQERLDRQSHRSLLVHAIGVLVLQELAQLLRFLSNCTGLPLTHSSRWLGLVQGWNSINEACDEGTDSKGSHTSSLSILLLSFTSESSNILDGRSILVLESEWLAFKSHFINEDTSISLQARESHHEVLIKTLDFSNCSWILKLCNRVFLYGQNDTIRATDGNCCTATINSFEGILDLEKLSIRTEDRVCFVVRWHAQFSLFCFFKTINQFIQIIINSW